MPAVSTTRVYGDVLSSTMDAIEKAGEMLNQVLDGIPLFAKIKERMKTRSGGSLIRIPLEYGVNATVKSFEHYDQFTMQPTTPFTSALYNWKAVGGVCMISGMEMRANNGPEELFDLWAGRYKNLVHSFQSALNTMFHSDGSGNSSKDLLGLAAIVKASGTLGGISATDNTWWASPADTVGSFVTYGTAKLRSMWCSVGSNIPDLQPDLLMSVSTWYNAYETIIQPYEQFTRTGKASDSSQIGDVGFRGLAFKGAEWIWDDATTAATIYMLNTRRLFMVAHKDAMMKMSPKREMDDQDAWATKVIHQAELVTDHRRAHGLLNGITA